MLTRPFVTFLKSAMQVQKIKTIAELAERCKGRLSATSIYSIAGGTTPNAKAVKILCEVLQMDPTIAESARDEQKAIDLRINPKVAPNKKTKKSEDEFTTGEKNLLHTLRKMSAKNRSTITYLINTLGKSK